MCQRDLLYFQDFRQIYLKETNKLASDIFNASNKEGYGRKDIRL